MGGSGLEHRVVAAAQDALDRHKFVTVTDVCIGLGWLHERHLDAWRQGRVADLEYFLPVHDDRLASIASIPAGPRRAAARHTSLRGSGRVGRSAAGQALDEKAIGLAVVASVRHEDTDYDSMLMSGVPRDEARERIKPAIDRVLADWA